MDVTTNAANALTAAMDKLAGVVEPTLLQAVKDDITQIIQAEISAISQVGQVIQSDLAPVVNQLDRFNTSIESLMKIIAPLAGGFLVVPAVAGSGK